MTNLIALPSGTELVGDYRIERVLGAGGFGITYLADEIALDRAVTIKEYFPSDFAARNNSREAVPRSKDCSGDYRWGLDRFIEEAQILARFDHPNIVRVYRYFRANNTGYMVLQWEEGKSLKTWLKELKRAPRQKELDTIIAPLLDALEMIHKADFLHRDIAPDNIIVRKSGAPVLIDFGSARGEIAAHSKTVSALVKPGYSPYEQYAETSRRQGPWTDIYALGATLYHAVTGKRPPDAPSRMVHDELVSAREAALSSYRPGFLAAIDRALALEIKDRPQSIAAWRGDLLAPEPARQGWLSKALDKAREEEANHLQNGIEAAAAAGAAPQATMPPPPDLPGPQGGLLDFLDRLAAPTPAGKRQDAKQDPAAPAKNGKKPASASNAKAAAEQPAATQMPPKMDAKAAAQEQQPTKAKPRKAAVGDKPNPPAAAKAKSSQPEREAAAKPGKGEIVPVPRQRLPRLFTGNSAPKPHKPKSARRLPPLLAKLAIGACVAAAAVMLQNRLPQIVTVTKLTPMTATAPAAAPTTPVSPQVSTVLAHKGGVAAMQYSVDGSRLYTTGADETLKSWNTSNLGLIRQIPLDAGPASSIAVNGDVALTGHADGQVVAWDLATARKRASYRRNEADVWSLTFAGNDHRFLAATHDWKITLWDADQAASPLHVFDGHDNAVQALAYADHGSLIASGGADRTVKLWNLSTLDLVRTYKGAKDFITSTAISPDGKLVAAASLDGSIRLWSTSSQRQRRRYLGHTGAINQIAFAPDSRRLVSAGSDGTVRLWDIDRRRAVRAFTGHQGQVKAVAFSPDGSQVASGGADGTVRIWTAKVAAGSGS